MLLNILFFLCPILAWLLTIWLYSRLKTRHPEKKYLWEILFIGFALLSSIAAKTCMIFQLIGENCAPKFPWNAENALQAFLYGIYAAIGGLTFEGIDMELIGSSYGWLYYGSSLYAGLVALAIISITVNYEVFSKVSLPVIRLGKRIEEFYIFTSATEETFLLARNIAEERKGRSLILFSGNELEPFDKRNPIHMDIMRSGYYYWSYSKAKKHKNGPGVLQELGLEHFLKKKNQRQICIHIFAMGKDKKEAGFEEKNSDIVFDEIGSILRYYEKMKPLPNSFNVVNFHILTNCDVNFRFYDEKVKKIVADYCRRKNILPEVEKELKYSFQIRVVDEADLAAEDMIEANNRILMASYLAGNKLTHEQERKAMLFGFGQVGQKSLNKWFENASEVDNNGRPVPVSAEVYDRCSDNFFGDYAYDHPLYRCLSESDVKDDTSKGEFEEKRKKKLSAMFGDLDASNLERDLGCPTVLMKTAEVFDSNMSKRIERFFCSDSFDTLIIALGKDSDNFTLANHFLEYYKQGEGSGEKYIFVNIRDEKNLDRIDWDEEEEKNYPNLKVVTFGCREDMYTYQKIVNEDEDILYNHVYKLLNDDAASIPEDRKMVELFLRITNWLLDQEESHPTLQEIKDVIERFNPQKSNREAMMAAWKELDLYRKRSNRAARLFAANYYCREKIAKELPEQKEPLVRWMQIEHLRWNRFSMANGWSFHASEGIREKKNFYRKMRMHHCIVPFENLSNEKSTKKYDFANVMMTYYIYKSVDRQE